MTNEQLVTLFQEGERKYLEDLWEQNKGLVYRWAKRYAGPYNPVEDLAQIGFLGLVKAAEGFDATLGYKFTTYADKAIMGTMYRELYHSDDLSLDYKYKNNSDDDEGTLRDTIVDPNAIDPEEHGVEKAASDELRDLLTEAFKETLTNREVAILKERYLLRSTFKALGEKYGISTERICQIHRDVLRKLYRIKKIRYIGRAILDIETDAYSYRTGGLSRQRATGISPVESVVMDRERTRERLKEQLG